MADGALSVRLPRSFPFPLLGLSLHASTRGSPLALRAALRFLPADGRTEAMSERQPACSGSIRTGAGHACKSMLSVFEAEATVGIKADTYQVGT